MTPQVPREPSGGRITRFKVGASRSRELTVTNTNDNFKLHRAGGRGGAPHPPATEGPHWGMGGVRTDGPAEGQDPPLQQD